MFLSRNNLHYLFILFPPQYICFQNFIFEINISNIILEIAVETLLYGNKSFCLLVRFFCICDKTLFFTESKKRFK